MRRYFGKAVLVASVAGAASSAACRRGGVDEAAADPAGRLDRALAPAAAAEALRKLGGAHVHGSARFTAGYAPGTPGLPDAGVQPPEDSVTTTTDVWLAPGGDFRMVESNDRDGGREVVLAGRELFVALRYGKMVERAAEEPEPTRLLGQAVGAPFAAWELARRAAVVTPLPRTRVRGRPAIGFRLSRAPLPGPGASGEPLLRRWRESVVVDRLEGEIRLDAQTGAPLEASLRVTYAANRGEKVLRGEAEVALDVDEVGAIAAVARPAAEKLVPHQRTLLDERALLGDLPPAPPPSRPAGPGGSR